MRGSTQYDAGHDKALARFRTLCLSFPETSEKSSWGHPNFKAGQKIFAAYEIVRGRPSIAFRLEPVDVHLLLNRKQFFAIPYGRGQWASHWADGRINWREVKRLLDRSYRLVKKPEIQGLRLRQGSGGTSRARAATPKP